MNRKITSVVLMVVVLLFLLISAVATVPPRRLTGDHIRMFAMIPAGAFLAALPGVPCRWFAYFSALAVAFMLAVFSYQIDGTSYRLGWNEGIARAILPIVIIGVVVGSSVVAAWVRQMLHTAIGRLKRNANNTPDSIRQPADGSPKPSR